MVGGLVGTFVYPVVGTAGGAATGASLFSAAATSLQGGDIHDVAHSALSGAIAGYLGPGIGNLMKTISTTGIQAIVRAGTVVGSIKALLMGAEPISKPKKDNPCP